MLHQKRFHLRLSDDPSEIFSGLVLVSESMSSVFEIRRLPVELSCLDNIRVDHYVVVGSIQIVGETGLKKWPREWLSLPIEFYIHEAMCKIEKDR